MKLTVVGLIKAMLLFAAAALLGGGGVATWLQSRPGSQRLFVGASNPSRAPARNWKPAVAWATAVVILSVVVAIATHLNAESLAGLAMLL